MTPQEEQDRYTYLKLKQKQAMASGSQQHAEPTLGNMAKLVPQMAGVAVEDTAKRFGPAALPILGGAAGAPFGLAAPGAALGQLGKNAINTMLNPAEVPKTPLGNFADVVSAGVMQEPKILRAIPGVGPVVDKASSMASSAISKTGTGLAKAAQTFSGGKAGDFIEAAKKGYATYGAPSMQKAKTIFKSALAKLPGEDVPATIHETIKSALTPEASAGNKYLMDISKRLDAGELIDARQALKAKQALDDVIETVPYQQKLRRQKLFDLKSTFDDILSNQSGPMKKASNIYRSAILKDNLTKPFPVNKNGEYSRLAGMLSTLGASVGTGIGLHKGGSEGGVLGGLTPLATAVALSPLALGGAATTAGAASRGLMKLGENPAIRQTLLQVLQKIMANKRNTTTP